MGNLQLAELSGSLSLFLTSSTFFNSYCDSYCDSSHISRFRKKTNQNNLKYSVHGYHIVSVLLVPTILNPLTYGGTGPFFLWWFWKKKS